MIERLRGWLRRRSRRAIYHYWDGRKWTAADPLQVLLAIDADDSYRPDVHPVGVDAGDAESTNIMLSMIRRVFSLESFDPQTLRGLTMAETFSVYSDFCQFCDELKKNTRSLPTPPPHTGPTSTESGEPTTPGMSQCASRSSEPKSENPTE